VRSVLAWLALAACSPAAPTTSPPVTIEVDPNAVPITDAPPPEAPVRPPDALLDPSKAKERAPDFYTVHFDTTAGPFEMACERRWAPYGADRIYNLVVIGFFTDVAIFRVVPGFVAQWGIHGDPEIAAAWQDAYIEPDPVGRPNLEGTVAFAKSAVAQGTTQLFVNYKDNGSLDGLGFSPVCNVTKGMATLRALRGGEHHQALASAQGQIAAKGNAFLRAEYPSLDYIVNARIVR
jgi:peptidyl-prolyl cis-trans isomerase A (cyclophilin A)